VTSIPAKRAGQPKGASASPDVIAGKVEQAAMEVRAIT